MEDGWFGGVDVAGKDVGYLVATGREVMTSIVYGMGCSQKAKSKFG